MIECFNTSLQHTFKDNDKKLRTMVDCSNTVGTEILRKTVKSYAEIAKQTTSSLDQFKFSVDKKFNRVFMDSIASERTFVPSKERSLWFSGECKNDGVIDEDGLVENIRLAFDGLVHDPFDVSFFQIERMVTMQSNNKWKCLVKFNGLAYKQFIWKYRFLLGRKCNIFVDVDLGRVE